MADDCCGSVALCELGSMPVIAAVPARLTTITDTAAAAIRG
jgi:hypothetical protein